MTSSLRHGHQTTFLSETVLEATWALLEGSCVSLEGAWTALGKLLGGSWEALGGFQEVFWVKNSNS